MLTKWQRTPTNVCSKWINVYLDEFRYRTTRTPLSVNICPYRNVWTKLSPITHCQLGNWSRYINQVFEKRTLQQIRFLWRDQDNTHGWTEWASYNSNNSWTHRPQSKGNNFTCSRKQLHCYCAQKVEPYHKHVARRSTRTLEVIPKQKQQQRVITKLCLLPLKHEQPIIGADTWVYNERLRPRAKALPERTDGTRKLTQLFTTIIWRFFVQKGQSATGTWRRFVNYFYFR